MATGPLPKGRILALDLGARRIGMAISDELGIAAHGLETMQRTNERRDLARLARLAEQRQVSRIVVGNPLRLDGREGSRSQWARRFAEKLQRRSGREVVLRDERLTSVEANSLLAELGARRRARAADVDRMAAILLLTEYLHSRP